MAQKIILAGNAITAQILHSYLFRPTLPLQCHVDDEFVSKGGVGELPAVPISALASAFPAGECRVLMAIGYSDLNRIRESVCPPGPWAFLSRPASIRGPRPQPGPLGEGLSSWSAR
jgi:hypothetical protein